MTSTQTGTQTRMTMETAGQATRDNQEVNDRVAKDAKSMASKRATLGTMAQCRGKAQQEVP